MRKGKSLKDYFTPGKNKQLILVFNTNPWHVYKKELGGVCVKPVLFDKSTTNREAFVKMIFKT